MDHVERLAPSRFAGLLAPSAHLIKADRGERPDQREAGGQREQQRQHVIAEGEPRQHQAGQRVDDAEKRDIGAERREIVEPAPQRIPDVGGSDLPHRRGRCVEAARLAAGAADRLDGMAGKPQLIHAPFNGISDMHRRILPNRVRGPRAAWWPTCNPAAGHRSSRDPPSRISIELV